ncbi:fibroleukin [Rhinatrema bivittatum]|uniref:fibroleukin n=1 Tax=Rhinatrema bivittatum TaxID=194408 RepID=UPI001127F8CD|nr:fibroleukin [Rhinatrema bivittatum]
MNPFVHLVLLQTLLFSSHVFAVADEGDEGSNGKVVHSCPIRLRNGGKCEEDECPYQVTLPPMTIQLPRQFHLLEKTIKEVQTLKESINKLKKSCQDCKWQADDNQETASNEMQVPDSETPTASSNIENNKIQELQSKLNRVSISLKNAKNQINTLQSRLEKINLINMDNVENYVDSKVANLTFVVNSLDSKCSSTCPAVNGSHIIQLVYRNCADHLKAGKKVSGIYKVTPDLKNSTFEVYCDMETLGGGWTVLQMRQDGSTSFNRTWTDYKNGFGNLRNEFWLGNDKIHLLTKSSDMQLRIELEDLKGIKEHAKYKKFYVANEYLKYRLTIGGYDGTAGDAMHYSKQYNHDQKFFTTPDKDNDKYPSGNCGAYYSSGWWFDACLSANLNGKYYHKDYKGIRNGIFWGTWHSTAEVHPNSFRQAFKSVKMMVRPNDFIE